MAMAMGNSAFFAFMGLLIMAANAAGAISSQFSLVTNGIVVVHAHHYLAVPVRASNLSFVVYYTTSNIPVNTLVLSGAQLQQFNSTKSVSHPVSSNYSNATINVFLANQTDYIVMYSPYSDAKVRYYVNASSNFTHSNATTYVGSYYLMPPRHWQSFYIHQETAGSPFGIVFSGLSSAPVSYSIYNLATNATVFNTMPETITNLNTSSDNVTFWYAMRLPPGLYSLNITNKNPANTTVYYEYRIIPDYVDPFLLYNFSSGHVPSGIASFGLLNNSGNIEPYTVSTSLVVGQANLTALQVNTPPSMNPNSRNILPDAVSLQLNAILKVTNKDGSTFDYWSQTVVLLLTKSHTICMVDNIFNMSSDGATLTNNSIVSSTGGYVPWFNGTSSGYYGNYNSSSNTSEGTMWGTCRPNYTLPLKLFLLLNESVVPGNGTEVRFGVESDKANNITGKYGPLWYDTADLLDPNASSSVFYVSGDQYTPAGAASNVGRFYDSELVAVGQWNMAAANFTDVNGTLGLYYYDNTTNSLLGYPSTYTFGSDTGETSQNLLVTSKKIYAALSTGNPVYDSLYSSPTANSFLAVGDAWPQPYVPVHAFMFKASNLLYFAAALAVLVVLAMAYIALRMAKRAGTGGVMQGKQPIKGAGRKVRRKP